MGPDEKDYDKPVAVRGSPGGVATSKFNPWAGGTYAMDRLRLPGFTPRVAKKPEPLNFGFATSDYSDVKNNATGDASYQNKSVPQDAKAASPTAFRLQKPPSVKKAETVRLIRVNSTKSDNSDPEPAMQNPSEPQTKTVQTISEPPKPAAQPRPQAKPQPNTQPETQQPRRSMTEKARNALRYSVASEISEKPRDSYRNTMMSTSNEESRESKRYTMASVANDESGWRPPNRASRANTTTTAQRLAFRDSAEPEAEDPGWKPRANAFSMASVSTLMRAPPSDYNNAAQKPSKRTGPSFATFPTVRNGPPSMVNRPRPSGPPKKKVEIARGSATMFEPPN
jgi:hypothetical protein